MGERDVGAPRRLPQVHGAPDCVEAKQDQRLAEDEERLPGREILAEDLEHPQAGSQSRGGRASSLSGSRRGTPVLPS